MILCNGNQCLGLSDLERKKNLLREQYCWVQKWIFTVGIITFTKRARRDFSKALQKKLLKQKNWETWNLNFIISCHHLLILAIKNIKYTNKKKICQDSRGRAKQWKTWLSWESKSGCKWKTEKLASSKLGIRGTRGTYKNFELTSLLSEYLNPTNTTTA